MKIYFRLRKLSQNGQRSFVEQFVMKDGLLLQGPEMPKRFEGRLEKAQSFEIHGMHQQFQQVDSKPVDSIQKRKVSDFGQGLWITFSDCTPKGQLEGLVDGRCVVFGILVDDLFASAIQQCHSHLLMALGLSLEDDPLVVQHGTSKSLVKAIASSGLQPTDGMLGRAIYLGSFWKAYRYAIMDAEFVSRPGAIFRVLAFWPKVFLRKDAPLCSCPRCADFAKIHGPDSIHVASDHLGTWQISQDAVWVPPYKTSRGWSVKNDEQACKTNESIFLESVGYVENASVEDRNGLERNFQID